MTSQQPRSNDQPDLGTEGSFLNTRVAPRQEDVGFPNDRPDLGTSPRHVDVGFPWLACAGFAFLTINSGTVIWRSKGDVETAVFVACSYFAFLLLFYFLERYKKAPHGSPQRDRLKDSVWALTMTLIAMLTLLFAYVVMGATGLTLPVALHVWAIAFATGIAAFYAFFEQDRLSPLPDEATLPLSRV